MIPIIECILMIPIIECILMIPIIAGVVSTKFLRGSTYLGEYQKEVVCHWVSDIKYRQSLTFFPITKTTFSY